MLVSLSVRNFKSIDAATVRFGPLTGLIGHNGVGKSNLLDAIQLLSALAEGDVGEAVASVRRTSDGTATPLDLVGGRNPGATIELAADLIVPRVVVDDFGQEAEASTTLLRYEVHLRYEADRDRLVIGHERLDNVRLGDVRRFTRFPTAPAFRDSVAVGSRRGGPLITTETAAGEIVVHGDGGSRPRSVPVGRSPLTVLGGANAADYPTVLAAKREMQSWRLLHLEPSAMRAPDHRSAPPHVSAAGGHLPATLNGLLSTRPDVAAAVVDRLRRFNGDVEELAVFTDEIRGQLALRARLAGVDEWLLGRSLSEGTLRSIALTLMLVDDRDRAVLCVEEPENGIHPSRVPALVDLLYDYAVDSTEPAGSDNPLRQVIVNTHSPEVARQLDADDLVFVERIPARPGDGGGSTTVFRPIAGSWRVDDDGPEPQHIQALADFIGGAPVRSSRVDQLTLDFGTAT